MKPAATKHPATFEAALKELEGIVQALESGNTPLEDALHAYERGVALLGQCQETLGQAEQKIRILDDGRLRDLGTAEPTGGSDA
ncbi:MAG: exodeoxyribonuclease small subunit [Pseudomonadota bacterium]|nr:exodeoxyribonuclease small subunit [Pseudomonadota bacterium]